jgi:mRNA-degrading endonuclease toxin of MazEF toxin-antitoxin module
MRNLKLLLQREPTAVGSLVASVMPVLVLLGVVRIDEAGIAAIVVAVNTIVGLAVRMVVTPVATEVRAPVPART